MVLTLENQYSINSINLDNNIFKSVMALTKTKKETIIKQFKKSDTDTGSANVQIALLNERITSLTDHLKSHGKDFSSRRGLLHLVNQRRKLLVYLKSKDNKSYTDIIKKLKLKG